MPVVLLVLLLGGVALEVWVAILVADLVGWPPVLLLLVGSALVGGRVLRRGAVRAWHRVAEASRSGDRIGRSVLDAGLVVVAGVLLLLPGLLSGALGLLLLLPPVRAVLRPFLGALVARRALPLVLGARLAGRAAGPARRGGPADVEGHATERRAGPRDLVHGDVPPASPGGHPPEGSGAP